MMRIPFVLAVCALTAAAQSSFTYTSFPNATGLVPRGSTAFVGGMARLTAQVSNQTGVLWHGTAMPVVAGFDTTFTFRITPPPVGRIAEGMAFIIQNSPSGTNAQGGGVWALGYGSNGAPGISNSLAIELVDTYQDGFLGDTSNNELSVHTNGTGENMEEESFSIGRITPTVNVGNGLVHTARVRYVPGSLRIYINNLTVPVLTVPYDFQTGGTFLTGQPVGGLNLPSATAFIGFSAANGAGTLTEQVDIMSWSWTSDPGTDPCFDGNVGLALGAPQSVLRVNNSVGDFFRRVSVGTYRPITFSMQQGPVAAPPADFVLFVQPGPSVAPFASPFGSLCFDPFAPTNFVLADSFNLGLGAIFPATAAPWSLTLPTGLPVIGEWLIQGAMVDATAPTQLAVTNGVLVQTFQAPAPTISGLAPAGGNPGTVVTLQGTGFDANTRLTVGGIPVVPGSVFATSLLFTVPAGAGCAAPVVLTNPDGLSATRIFNPLPDVTNLIPTSGPQAGGTNLIIVANGITPGSTVTIGGVFAPVVLTGASFIRVLTPPMGPGPQPVVITTAQGCVGASGTFTYN